MKSARISRGFSLLGFNGKLMAKHVLKRNWNEMGMGFFFQKIKIPKVKRMSFQACQNLKLFSLKLQMAWVILCPKLTWWQSNLSEICSPYIIYYCTLDEPFLCMNEAFALRYLLCTSLENRRVRLARDMGLRVIAFYFLRFLFMPTWLTQNKMWCS